MVQEHAEMGLAVATPLIIRGRNLDRMSDLTWEVRSGDCWKSQTLGYHMSLSIWTANTKMPHSGWLKQQVFISQSPRGWEVLDQGACKFRVWWESRFLVYKWLLSCCSSHGRERTSSSLSFLLRTLISLYRGSTFITSSEPNYFPEAPPPNTIPLGNRFLAYEFGGTSTCTPGAYGRRWQLQHRHAWEALELFQGSNKLVPIGRQAEGMAEW